MPDANTKPLCKYGDQCYRKNPVHLAEYRHPHLDRQPQQELEPSNADAPPPAVQLPAVVAESNAASAAVGDSRNRRNSGGDQAANRVQQHNNNHHHEQHVNGENGEPERKKPTGSVPHSLPPQQCFDSNTDAAQRLEYARLILDRPAFILDKMLVTMPADFYLFWEFCAELEPDDPGVALERAAKLRMVGPFDVLAGRFDAMAPREPGEYLRHCRYFYDPPEFQTVLVPTGVGTEAGGLHYGYWRDDPRDTDRALVAQTDVDRGCEVQLIAENIFGAVLHHLQAGAAKRSPFEQSAANAWRAKLERFARTHGIVLDGLSRRLRERQRTVVARTFHSAGLVVSVDGDVGYRPLIETPAGLRTILGRLDDPEDGDSDAVVGLVMEKLQPIVTAANIAVDESDFGTVIELGLDFFAHGSRRLHALTMQLLATGYAMVQRPQWIAIVKAHLSQRRRGYDVSIV